MLLRHTRANQVLLNGIQRQCLHCDLACNVLLFMCMDRIYTIGSTTNERISLRTNIIKACVKVVCILITNSCTKQNPPNNTTLIQACKCTSFEWTKNMNIWSIGKKPFKFVQSYTLSTIYSNDGELAVWYAMADLVSKLVAPNQSCQHWNMFHNRNQNMIWSRN